MTSFGLLDLPVRFRIAGFSAIQHHTVEGGFGGKLCGRHGCGPVMTKSDGGSAFGSGPVWSWPTTHFAGCAAALP